MTAARKLLELAERGRNASPAAVPAPIVAPRAGACAQCRALPTELIAFDKWPAQLEVERCACGAVTSFKDPAASTPEYTVRKRIER